MKDTYVRYFFQFFICFNFIISMSQATVLHNAEVGFEQSHWECEVNGVNFNEKAPGIFVQTETPSKEVFVLAVFKQMRALFLQMLNIPL
jgi:hypothetical protein